MIEYLGFDLTSPYDVSTCAFANKRRLDTAALQDGSNAGDIY